MGWYIAADIKQKWANLSIARVVEYKKKLLAAYRIHTP
jgi:hypothetical protein